jgi:murein DD-endopeptidase MepM/ murein hydrolase activator NlpD
MNTDMTYSVYGGLEKDGIAVKPGDTIVSGDLIGYSGDSNDMGEPGMSFFVIVTGQTGQKPLKFKFWNDADQSFIAESAKCYDSGIGEVPCD